MKNKINPFLDDRPLPNVNINVKIKVKTKDIAETQLWNDVFGYFMKKPRTKLEFLTTSIIRKLDLSKIKVNDLSDYVLQEDFLQLKKIEDIFNNRLTLDIKSFIIAILRIKLNILEEIIKQKEGL